MEFSRLSCLRRQKLSKISICFYFDKVKSGVIMRSSTAWKFELFFSKTFGSLLMSSRMTFAK
jgi:hypothetical protein